MAPAFSALFRRWAHLLIDPWTFKSSRCSEPPSQPAVIAIHPSVADVDNRLSVYPTDGIRCDC